MVAVLGGDHQCEYWRDHRYRSTERDYGLSRPAARASHLRPDLRTIHPLLDILGFPVGGRRLAVLPKSEPDHFCRARRPVSQAAHFRFRAADIAPAVAFKPGRRPLSVRPCLQPYGRGACVAKAALGRRPKEKCCLKRMSFEKVESAKGRRRKRAVSGKIRVAGPKPRALIHVKPLSVSPARY